MGLEREHSRHFYPGIVTDRLKNSSVPDKISHLLSMKNSKKNLKKKLGYQGMCVSISVSKLDLIITNFIFNRNLELIDLLTLQTLQSIMLNSKWSP